MHQIKIKILPLLKLGLERHGRGRSGVLENGITTLLYKKLEPHSNPIHSIQLLPVFVDEGTEVKF